MSASFESFLSRLRIDSLQRSAVETEQTSVVSAGAGSGKTLVLALRYLRLIASGKVSVRQVLALTFTRKAAAEMYERIHAYMMELSDDPLIQQALEEFAHADVSTLDSFCSQIVRCDCMRYGIPPSFTEDSVYCEKLAEETAWSFLISHQKHPGAAFLLEYSNMEEIVSDILLPLAKDRMAVARPLDLPALEKLQADRCRSLADQEASAMCGMAEGALQYGPSGTKQGIACGETARRLCELLEARDDQGLLRDLPGMKMAKPIGKAPYDRYWNEHAELWNRSASLLYQALTVLSQGAQRAQAAVFLAEFQDEFIAGKIRSEVLSFYDVAVMAVEILKNNREIRSFYKRRYRYILIDEFQDNNQLQKELLYLLAERHDRDAPDVPDASMLEPGKLFFVGDEKQSIYRFRGADVSVFKGLKEELEAYGGRSLELGSNYRSDAKLIDFFNTLFPGVMEHHGEPYEAAFTPMRAGLGPGVSGAPVTLFYKPLKQSTGEGASEDEELLNLTEAEAWHIARWVRSTVETRRPHLRCGNDGKTREMTYDDVAVLLRTTSGQLHFERAFRHMGIPYTVETHRALYLDAPVNDLYLFIQVLAYPQDRRAYAALLRSPFCSLDDMSVLEILSQKAPPFEPEDLFGRLAPEALACYREMKDLADRVPLSTLVRELWYRGGYRYFVLKRKENHPYLELYDYMKHMALLADRRGDSLALFADSLRPHLGTSEKAPEMELLRRGSGGVRIMTVHKAKGLEFPVVVLANAGSGTRTSANAAMYDSLQYGPAVTSASCPWTGKRVNLFRELEKELQKKQEEAELKRLLYVAATRAEQMLVISGGHHKQNAAAVNLLNMILSSLKAEPGEAMERSLAQRGVAFSEIPDITEADIQKMRTHTKHRKPQDLMDRYEKAGEIVYLPAAKTCTVTELQAAAGERADYPAGTAAEGAPGEEDPRLLGTLCHLMVSRLLSHERMPEVISELELPGEFLKLSDAVLRQMAERARELVERFMGEVISRYRDQGAVITSEMPFAMRLDRNGDDILVHGQVDLIIELPDYLLVVDLKTDKVFAPQQHALQLSLYRDAVSRLYGKHAAAQLYYLRTGEIWELP